MSAEAVSRIGCRCDGVSIDAVRPCWRLDERRREAGYPLIAGVPRCNTIFASRYRSLCGVNSPRRYGVSSQYTCMQLLIGVLAELLMSVQPDIDFEEGICEFRIY
jgi:hypothetical protein